MKIIITCEHGGNKIPPSFSLLFKEHQQVLASHKGWDLGILGIFEYVKNEAHFYKCSTISRLLIEKNRSLHHKNLFSTITKGLPNSVKQRIIETHYLPYRNEVEQKIVQYINTGNEVLHISLHSFTSVLSGVSRHTDIGFLYDPRRSREKFWAKKMKKNLLPFCENKMRFNYPYLGIADGFTTYLRKKLPEHYSGIEIEINQALLVSNDEFPLSLKKGIKKMLQIL